MRTREPALSAALKLQAPGRLYGFTCLRLWRTTKLTMPPFGNPSISPTLVTHDVLDRRVRDHFLQHVREVLEDDDDRRAGIDELVLELARGVQRIGVDDGHAGAQRAVHDDGVLQDVRHHDGDAVALLESAAGLQERAELRRQHVELADR